MENITKMLQQRVMQIYYTLPHYIILMNVPGGGGVVPKNLGRYVPLGLSKNRLPNCFYGLKLGSPEQIFAKFGLRS